MSGRKTKVLIGINDFLVGGAQRLIANQLKYADGARYEFHLLTFFEFPERKNLYALIPPTVQVHRLRMTGGYDIGGLIKLIRILFSIRPRIVFSHLFLSNSLLRILKPLFGYRIFTVEHNTYVGKRPWHVGMDRMLAPLTEKIIAVSEEVRALTISQQRVPPQKCIVIKNGIDIAPIKEFCEKTAKEEARRKLQIPLESIMLLSVGRLTTQKNQELLIRAFALLAKQQKSLVLFIAGEGELKSNLQKLIQNLSMENQIFLIGATDQIYTYYRAADFLISTSKIEGMSMAFLEALAFGLPLVVTETGGTKALVQEGKNGFIIQGATPESACGAMQKALQAEYMPLSQEAQRTAERFTIEENMRAYESLIG